MSGHAERLRHAAGFADTQDQEWMLRDAAARIDKLEAENQRLRDAIRSYLDDIEAEGISTTQILEEALAGDTE